jgi:cytochrome b6-f complex iron-sulfur subunit
MSSAALMAFYCMGTLSACSSKKDDPAPVVITPASGGTGTGTATNTGVTGNASTAGGAINFTIDLANATFASLKTAGNFVNVGEVIVFNAAGTYKALGRICTHAGGNLSFRSASNDLICDVHGGLFNTDGSVKQSPPTVAVKSYPTTLTADKLQVKA